MWGEDADGLVWRQDHEEVGVRVKLRDESGKKDVRVDLRDSQQLTVKEQVRQFAR